MSNEEDVQRARDYLDAQHRLANEVLDAILRVSDETGRDLGEVAQMVQQHGGGGYLMPLMQSFHERQQRRFLEMQQRVQAQTQTQTPQDAAAEATPEPPHPPQEASAEGFEG
jgi:predicted RNA-binding protein YlxR (DUF448 family)